ncbi:MAG: CopG family transcriptional regulator [Gammaproteobacteria bacterium]|nr:CopG family transcriptional regulator [Gammaproteobacteria bacterium]MBU1722473.1 CopG family transcriptional regulator [Gammaproteobacteria bacterium]MBU2005506.1 CopG family transcriptional regulator [Gammaproteobacteria bacterium]
MSKESIGFRIESEKRVALDELAQVMHRDRTTLINEAIDAYLDLHHWQVEIIKRSQAAANAGEAGVEHAEVFRNLRARLLEKMH